MIEIDGSFWAIWLKGGALRGESALLCPRPPAVRDYAVLGSRRIESRRNCGVISYAQQQFGGSDDPANQDPTRSNFKVLKHQTSHK